MGSLKPGLLRLVTLRGRAFGDRLRARHIIKPGRLGRVRTIHFARWVLLGGSERLSFFSNYDGSVESYMDDFINKIGFGLNVFFSNGIGYPRTELARAGRLRRRAQLQGVPAAPHRCRRRSGTRPIPA